MTDWSDEQLAAVASVDIVTVARDDAPPARVHKLRLWNKVAALDTLAKYLGLLTEKIELDQPVPILVMKQLPEKRGGEPLTMVTRWPRCWPTSPRRRARSGHSCRPQAGA